MKERGRSESRQGASAVVHASVIPMRGEWEGGLGRGGTGISLAGSRWREAWPHMNAGLVDLNRQYLGLSCFLQQGLLKEI